MFYIIIGSVVLSASFSYFWWSRVRVIDLRQDVYGKRDELFDIAMRLGALDDPAYRYARRHLNHIARTVEFISLDLLVYVSRRASRREPIRTDNRPLQAAIDQVCASCARRIGESLLRETLPGLILLTRFRLRGILAALEGEVIDRMTIWLSSNYPESLDRTENSIEQMA